MLIGRIEASDDILPAVRAIGEALRALEEMADANDAATHRLANEVRIAAKGKPGFSK